MLRLLFVITFSITAVFTLAHVNAEGVSPSAVLERRAQLESELQQIEAQINGYRGIIQKKQREATSLERDIAIFNARIKKAHLSIRALNIRIDNLSLGIKDRSATINSLLEKIDKEKISLGELLRKTNELDSVSLVELVLGYGKLSDFFVDLDSFESIHAALQNSFKEIKVSKEGTEKEREKLMARKTEHLQLRVIQSLEKKRIEQAERGKKKILKLTKGEETRYQKIVKSRQKDAARIRSELFVLRGSKAIPFEKAMEYANAAWRAVGVRPAFLLGVIAEESNLGENVGTGNWKSDLANPRCLKQRTAFMEITGELGLNPDMMPVSRKAWYGYCGGAMGPAQFMPTTWNLYKKGIAKRTGDNPPNPWDPRDAFMASALLLKDNGAAAGGYTAERRAALRYLAGGNWKKSAYSFYGDDVMELAEKYQKMIDTISQ